jgi:hypothetical protein
MTAGSSSPLTPRNYTARVFRYPIPAPSRPFLELRQSLFPIFRTLHDNGIPTGSRAARMSVANILDSFKCSNPRVAS